MCECADGREECADLQMCECVDGKKCADVKMCKCADEGEMCEWIQLQAVSFWLQEVQQEFKSEFSNRFDESLKPAACSLQLLIRTSAHLQIRTFVLTLL
jgi:hypothetical protein